jgi:purine-binding chemotaxis protein CheW
MDLAPQDIEAPPAFGTRVRVDYLQGMGKVGKRFVLLLDIDRVLAAGELGAAGALGESVPDGEARQAEMVGAA